MKKTSIVFAVLVLLGTACQRNLEVQTSQRNCPLKSGLLKSEEVSNHRYIITPPTEEVAILATKNTEVHSLTPGKVVAIDNQLKLMLVQAEHYYYVYKNVVPLVQVNDFVAPDQTIARLVSEEDGLGLQIWKDQQKIPAAEVARMCDCDSQLPVGKKN